MQDISSHSLPTLSARNKNFRCINLLKKTKIESISVQTQLNSIHYIVLWKYSGAFVVQYKIKGVDVLDGMAKFVIYIKI